MDNLLNCVEKREIGFIALLPGERDPSRARAEARGTRLRGEEEDEPEEEAHHGGQEPRRGGEGEGEGAPEEDQGHQAGLQKTKQGQKGQERLKRRKSMKYHPSLASSAGMGKFFVKTEKEPSPYSEELFSS